MKKSDEHLQSSPQSWLDDFIQPFSWRSLLVQALDFLNKLFFPRSELNYFTYISFLIKNSVFQFMSKRVKDLVVIEKNKYEN